MYSRSYSPGPTLDLSGLSSSTYRSYGLGSSYGGGHTGMAANPSLSRVMNMDCGLSDSFSSRSGGLSYESGCLNPLRASPLPTSIYGDDSMSRHLQFQTSSPSRLESRISSTIPSSSTSRRKRVPESRWSPSSRMTNGDYFDFSPQSIVSYTVPKASSYRRTDYSDYLHPLLGRRPILCSNYTPRSRAEREKSSIPLTRERKLIKFRESSDIVANVKRRISWILDDEADSSLTNGLKEKDEEVLTNRSRDGSLSRPLSRGDSPRMSRKGFSRDDSLTRLRQASQLKVNDSNRSADINFIQNRSPSPARLPIGSPRRQSRSRSRENSLTELDILPSPKNLSAALLSRDKLRKNSLEGKPPRRKSSCDSLQTSKDILSEIQGNHLKMHGPGVSGIKDRSLFDNKPEKITEISKSQFPERLYKTRKSIEEILPELFEKSNLVDTENKESSHVGQRKFSGQLLTQHFSHLSPESVNHSGTHYLRGQKRPSITEVTDMTASKISLCTSEKKYSVDNINTEIKPCLHRKSIKLKSGDFALTQDKFSKAEISSAMPEKSTRSSLGEVKINSNLGKPIESFSKNKLISKNFQIDKIQSDQSHVKTNLSHISFLTKQEVAAVPKQVPEVGSVQKMKFEVLSRDRKVLKDAPTPQEDSKMHRINLETSQHQISANILSPKSPSKINEKSKYIFSKSEVKQNKNSALHENDSKLLDSKAGQLTLLQTAEINHNEESQINHQEADDLKKPFQNCVQSKENSSSLIEPLKSLANFQTDVDKTKPVPKISKVPQYSSKTDVLCMQSSLITGTMLTEKSISKDAELSNSKYVAEKIIQQTALSDNCVHVNEKLTALELKTAPKTKDTSSKILCNNISADFKLTVDPKNIFKRKDSIPVCQIQEKSKPPVSTNTTNTLESEEIVVVCKLPQPKWLQQTKNSTFLLPNHITPPRGLKAPSVKQVAFQIRKETGTLIAEEIETTAHANIKVKPEEIDAQMNEVVDKRPDQQKTKQLASLDNDHKELEKAVVPKKPFKSKGDLNLKHDVLIDESKKPTPTTLKGPTHSVSVNTGNISDNKEDAIQMQENNIDYKVQASRAKNQNLESNKTLLADKDLQHPKLSCTLENAKKNNILKEKTVEAASCALDKSVEKRTSNLKTSSDEFSLKTSKQDESDFKTKANATSLSTAPAPDLKMKSPNDVKRVLKTEVKSTSNKKETVTSNIKPLNSNINSLDGKSIQQMNTETTIKISDEKPIAPLKNNILAIKQVIAPHAEIPEDTSIKQVKHGEKIDLKLAVQNDLQSTETTKSSLAVCKTAKIPDLKGKKLAAKISENVYEKSEIAASDPKVEMDVMFKGKRNQPKENFCQVDNEKNLNTDQIIEPQKEKYSQPYTSVLNKLGTTTDKQKIISASEISAGVYSKNKEKSHLKPLENEAQNSLNKKQNDSVSKTSNVSELKNKAVEVEVSKNATLPGKSEVIAVDSKEKTNGKTENLHVGEKKEQFEDKLSLQQPKQIYNRMDNDKSLKIDKTIKTQDENYLKPTASVPSKLENIHEKKITPTSEIVESINSKGIKDREKPNLNVITENEIQKSLDKKQNFVSCKDVKNLDSKNYKSEILASKYKAGYSPPISIASDLKEKIGDKKKDSLRLEEKGSLIKESLQGTAQSKDISVPQNQINFSKVNSSANLQNQNVPESVSPILPKPKTEAQKTIFIENSIKQSEKLKISEIKKLDNQTSIHDINKTPNVPNGEKEAILLKDASSKEVPKAGSVSTQNNATNGKIKALITDEKTRVKGESKLAFGAENKQPKISTPVATEITSPIEKHSLKPIELSVETEDTSVKNSTDTKLTKHDTSVLTSIVPKLDVNMKQKTETSTSIPNKDSFLSNKLIPKLTLPENEAQNNDSPKNNNVKSASDAKTLCVDEIDPVIKDKTMEAKKRDVPVNKNLEKNVEVIREPTNVSTLTVNIPEGDKRQLKACDVVEKLCETAENKEKPLSLAQIELNREILPKCVKERDAESVMEFAEQKTRKFSPKKCSSQNKFENTHEDISTKDLKKHNGDIYPTEQKSVPTCVETSVEDKVLINGSISSPIHELPKVDEVVSKYPKSKPRKMIGLFTQLKTPVYKSTLESSSFEDSGNDSNEETLPINTSQQKATGKSSEYDDRCRKRISSAGSTVSTATTYSNLSSSSEISNLSDDLQNSSLSPQNKLKFKKYTIDDFQFLKLLGKGSFGKVLLAELKNSSLYFAVKCLKKDVVLEDDDVESTMIERRILALGTQHPYMCKLYCTFQTDSHLCFVMEYLNGGDLMFHIQESGRFEQSRAMFYGAEVVSALGFLHKRGIVYRDMKLDNVVLDEEGHVRLVDFGMCQCRVYREECQPFNFCGTPQYIPPEIVTGQKYNHSVDWWSFGVLLYEMLTGRSPFNGTDEDELFWSICNEEPHYPRFLTKEALSILQLFLNKDPDNRLGMPSCPEGSIRQQAFFSPIDWNKLEKKQIKPPFKPHVKYASDTSNFDSNFTMDVATLTPVEMDILRSMDQEQFKGFSYTNPHITG